MDDVSSSSDKILPVKCSWGEKTSNGDATVRQYSSAERFLRVFKVIGIAWGVAVLFIFVPILHFFLVPLFLIGGLILGIMNGVEKGRVVSSHVNCANCEKEVSLKDQSDSWPKELRCGSCSVTLTLEI